MSTPLIALSCIVGNEEAVIERFIRSFAPVTKRMIFTHAAGKDVKYDSTNEIIDRVCEELEIDVTQMDYFNSEDWPHVDNFAKARNMAWVPHDPETAKYLLWADADDLLSSVTADILRQAAETGSSDVYVVPYEVRGKSQIIYRERMVRNDGCSKWRFPVHEVLGFTREVTYHVLKQAAVIHAPLSDKKHITTRNLTILQDSIKDGARHLFFLSQESLEKQHLPAFYAYSKAALAHPGLDSPEHYEILINLAQNQADTKEGQELAKTYAARAFEILPDRRESLALLASYALIDGRKDESLHLARLMASISMPRKAYWSLNREWYAWRGFYLLTQILRANDKEQEGLRLEQEEFQKHGAIFSICHPTYKRPHQALAMRELYLSRASNPMAVEYIFGIHHDDKESLALLSGYRHVITEGEGCCPNTLAPLKASTGKFVMIVADDLFPPEAWDDQILTVLSSEARDLTDVAEEWSTLKMALAFNDSFRPDWRTHLCHGFMTRPWLDEYMKDPWPGTGIFSDNEFSFRARKAGIIIECPQIVFDHRHYSNGKAAIDETYKDQNQRKNYEEGHRLLMERNPDYVDAPKSWTLAEKLDQVKARCGGFIVRFLQIGAHDGRSLDPIVERIYQEQWEGVFVEPQPTIFKKLCQNHPAREGLHFENCAIGEIDGKCKFYSFKDDGKLPYHATMLAGFSKDALIYNGHGYKGEIEETSVVCLSLESLLAKYKIEALDVLQIDTEGYDFEILKMLEKTPLRPMLIHYEHGILSGKDRKACQRMLKGMGYTITVLDIDTMAYMEGK